MKHLIAYGMPLFIIALAVPMILKIIPPNGIYGFRTPKTLSSPDIWYAANRVAGWFMCAGCLLAICVNLAIWWINPDWPDRRLIVWMANTMPVALVLSLVASFAYLKKL